MLISFPEFSQCQKSILLTFDLNDIKWSNESLPRVFGKQHILENGSSFRTVSLAHSPH